MEEALHSFNIKFKMQGFECQLTCRDDEKGTGLIVSQGQSVVRMLSGLVGVSPSNGNGKPALPGMPVLDPAALVCPVCARADRLELVTLKTGKKVYKCQRCVKWLPDRK